MTEQLEDDFWAQERARDTAARGKQADPTACGTCRGRVAAGGQVKHDECAQRATLLPAPDAPGYELITGLSEEELAALPPRFHTPAFMESSSPKLWVCAVCWGDGWSTQWPCATAVKHGLRVFTPEHEAETAAKKQAVRLAELEPQVDRLDHLDRITLPELRREIEHHKDGKARWRKRAETAEARVTELEAELAKYVGHEPTIAEEMAYLSNSLDAVLALCHETKNSGALGVTPEAVEQAASGEWTATAPRPALPWAAAMDDHDLGMFLDDLASAALNRWRTDIDGPVPDRDTLAAIEQACQDWRTPGRGLRGDEPGTGEGR
ncbi:hypothetical protein ACFXKC_28465 [Streptomyces sp. NPDC059340]|uniref:hypothetical protein n=1 Tax=Streptomyces sp. NPDC059340 TaxID=3346806 RepID=UPI0036A60593